MKNKTYKTIKVAAVLAVIAGFTATTATAALVLDVNPNTDGDWVMHLTGSHNGTGITFYDNLNGSTGWNQNQGGTGGSFVSDSIEEFSISGSVNSSITDPFDVGDGVVVGDTQLKGFHIDSGRVILKLDQDFGTSMSDFTGTVFDQTVILKPLDKGSYLTVWNPGTYTDGDFSLNVNTEVIPEPSVLALAGVFGAGLLGIRRFFLI